jgi:tetratricopeptide (TPR) repeat protein
VNKEPNVVAFLRRRGPDPAKVREFVATAWKIQEERSTTAELMKRLLRDTPQDEWPRLADSASLQTSAAVELLGREASACVEREPKVALALSELATSLASRIPQDDYPAVVIAQVRAHSWKDRAQALCYLSRYDEAMRALDRAEAELAPFGTLAHDGAIVSFQRAIVLQHLRQFDRARALLSECQHIFHGHDDLTLYSKCVLAEGNLLVRIGDHRTARELLLPLVGNTDVETEARVQTALAWSAMELDMHDVAAGHFKRAANGFDKCGATIEALRAEYGRGRALLRRGNTSEAIIRLQATRERFLGRSLVEEAGLCGLEVVEARLVRGEAAEAKRLATQLVHELLAASLNRRAATALAYLKEAIDSDSTTPDIVRSVASYMQMLRTEPTREFQVIN